VAGFAQFLNFVRRLGPEGAPESISPLSQARRTPLRFGMLGHCADGLVVYHPGLKYCGGCVCGDCSGYAGSPPHESVRRKAQRDSLKKSSANGKQASSEAGEFGEQLKMGKMASQALGTTHVRVLDFTRQVAIVVGASMFVALCARITLPLPFTPVPLTLQNFGVLLVGLMLGSRRGFAVLALYLAEGAAGLPVFNPTGPGGIAQLLGPTGGFLMVYPLVAGLAGWIMEHGQKSFTRAAVAGLLADFVLFAGGLGWLAILTHSLAQAVRLGFYWFIFAEVIKVMAAAAIAVRLRRAPRVHS